MARLRFINQKPHSQRGIVIIWFALLLPLLLGFAALAIDVARLNLAKVELQNAADAAALAGAVSVTGPNSKGVYDFGAVTLAAKRVARSHIANGRLIQEVTVNMGYCRIPFSDWRDYTGGYVPLAGEYPAVRITIAISRTANSGPLRFFFTPLLGILDPSLGIASSEIQAVAIAARSAVGHSILVK